MFIVSTFWLAFLLCLVTMLCWGSWANAQKLTAKQFPFQVFYWDYGVGVLLVALIVACTLGSFGAHGRSFLADLSQAKAASLWLAIIGGVVFNLANILLVTAIDIAGMSTAFPIAIGLALVLGVIVNYLAVPVGNAWLLSLGVLLILIAIMLSAYAYRRLQSDRKGTTLGILISLISGVLMGLFYRFVAAAMSLHFVTPAVGLLTPYTAMVFFSLGLFVSSFVFNSYMMLKPIVGQPVAFSRYFQEGFTSHLVGWIGGGIWGLGTIASFVAAGKAGFAISYGLGQGATMIAAAWGVFVWKEFANAPKGTNKIVACMFLLYIIGLVSLIAARFA